MRLVAEDGSDMARAAVAGGAVVTLAEYARRPS